MKVNILLKLQAPDMDKKQVATKSKVGTKKTSLGSSKIAALTPESQPVTKLADFFRENSLPITASLIDDLEKLVAK